MSTSIRFRLLTVVPVLAVVAFLAMPFMAQGVSFAAEDAICVFVSQEGNAWVVRKDSAIKRTLAVGDPIYQGDNLLVTHGNTVQLAFDKEAKNIVQIEGDTSLQISGSKPARLDISAGKIYAILDKKGPESHFKVFTPTAVAAVRGTHFAVGFVGQTSQVSTFEGEVTVAGRDAVTGQETKSFVVVGAGKKTAVEAPGIPPTAPQAMTESEKTEISQVLSKVVETKKWVTSQDADKLFNKDTKAADGGKSESTMVKSEDKEKKEIKKGMIIV